MPSFYRNAGGKTNVFCALSATPNASVVLRQEAKESNSVFCPLSDHAFTGMHLLYVRLDASVAQKGWRRAS